MKKKYTTTVYMKDVENYDISIFNNEDHYLVVKKINKVKKPFAPTGVVIMDDGFYVVDCLPKQENYTLRIFYNNKKKPILYYFDIVKFNALDEETGVPYYLDAYTDIMIFTEDNKIEIVDEDELLDALNNNIITKEEFDATNETAKKLYSQLVLGVNKFKNLNFKKYLK